MLAKIQLSLQPRGVAAALAPAASAASAAGVGMVVAVGVGSPLAILSAFARWPAAKPSAREILQSDAVGCVTSAPGLDGPVSIELGAGQDGRSGRHRHDLRHGNQMYFSGSTGTWLISA